MGDSIEFNDTWGSEKANYGGEADLQEVSSDELESKPNNVAPKQNASSAKLLKKKRKFEEMKSKKQLALTSIDGDSETGNSLMSNEEQCDLFCSLCAENDQKPPFVIAPENFVAITLSNSGKCAFSNVIMSTISNFKKKVQKVAGLAAGSPTVVVICSSAHRAADVINSLSKSFHCVIAKLFAKHFKLHEHVEFLKSQQCHIAVGTPNRIAKLLEYGALHLDNTQLVLIDMHLDSKSFSVITMADTKADFIDLMSSWIAPKFPQLKLHLVPADNNPQPRTDSVEGQLAEGNNNAKMVSKKSVKLSDSKDKFRHPKKQRK